MNELSQLGQLIEALTDRRGELLTDLAGIDAKIHLYKEGVYTPEDLTWYARACGARAYKRNEISDIKEKLKSARERASFYTSDKAEKRKRTIVMMKGELLAAKRFVENLHGASILPEFYDAVEAGGVAALSKHDGEKV